jgi:hypothetical protein
MTLIATRTRGSADRIPAAATGEPDNANAVEKVKKPLICSSLTETKIARSPWEKHPTACPFFPKRLTMK